MVSKNIRLTVLPCFSICERALCIRKMMASSILMFGWYANCSRSRKAVSRVLG